MTRHQEKKERRQIKQCKKVSKKGTLKKYIRKRKEEEGDKHTTVEEKEKE